MNTITDDAQVLPAGGGAAPERGTARSWAGFGALLAVLLASGVSIFLPLPNEAVGVAAIVAMISLILLRLPVAVAMLIPSLAGMYAMRDERVVESTLASLPYEEVANWSLSVLPLFVLMGLLLWKSGLTEDLYSAGRKWLGWLPGGLAVGTNVAGAGLAAVSGSSAGTAYALGRIGVPEMLKAGYDKRLAVGAVLVAGLPGQLIPPSILLVLYAGIAEVPVGQQLIAGVGPGVLVSVLFTIMLVGFATFGQGLAGTESSGGTATTATWRERFMSLVRSWPVPVIMLVIVVGMFSGVFTATEAGAVAAVCSFGVLLLWKRAGGAWRATVEASVAAVSTIGTIFLLLIGVAALSKMMTLTGISDGFAEFVAGMDLSRVEFLLLMTIVYLFLGAFMDPLPMMVLTVPILLPTLEALDVSLLWYGVFAVFLGELAVITPPVGILAMIVHNIVKDPQVHLGEPISLKDVFVAAAWFLPMAIVVVLVLIFFPEIATFLPAQGGGE